jgi:hypothetical protein
MVPGIDPNWTVGQPCLIQEDKRLLIVYTAWSNLPRKLGLLFCFQRPSCLFYADITQLLSTASTPTKDNGNPASTVVHRLLTPGLKTARSPRCSPSSSSSSNNRVLVFLGHEGGFQQHNGCVELFSVSVTDLLGAVGAVRAGAVGAGDLGTELGTVRVLKEVAEVLRTPSYRELGTTTTKVRGDATVAGGDGMGFPMTEVGMGFPGLYCDRLPRQPFLYMGADAGLVLVVNSQWGSSSCVLCVRLSGTGAGAGAGAGATVQRLDFGPGSVAVLDVLGAELLFAISTPTAPHRLGVSTATASSQVSLGPLKMRAPVRQGARLLRAVAGGAPVNQPPSMTDAGAGAGAVAQAQTQAQAQAQAMELGDDMALRGLNWRVFTHRAGDMSFDSVLLWPSGAHPVLSGGVGGVGEGGVGKGGKGGMGLPIVLVPHGGPHSVMPTVYSHAYAFLALQLGAAVMHVNYRGSPGFGQEGVLSLPGHIGTHDVADCLQALEHAKTLWVMPGGRGGGGGGGGGGEGGRGGELLCQQSEGAVPLVDSSRVCVVGGSHGGFLTGHLIGQQPDMFRAAAMRNPVTNIPAMYSVSDIPDWCYVETYGGKKKYDFSTYNALSEEDLVAMRRVSPVHYVERVKTPTLICLGSMDRRVPPSQGIEYYHLLRAQGVPTR